MTPNIILASDSPRRHELLKRIFPHFKICSPQVDEEMILSTWAGSDPAVLAMELAAAKARSVEHEWPNSLIIGCDTLVVIAGMILGKPHDAEHARKILQKLSGSRHSVISGLCLLDSENKKEIRDYGKTDIHMIHMSDAEIQAYIDSGEPFGKAGAYAIQESGDRFVSKIDGDFDTVVGLPCQVLRRCLKEFDV